MAVPASPADVTAGATLGLLTGFVVGLASQGAAGAVVTGLLAILGAFFGLAKDTKLAASSPARIIAFSLAASVALVAGLVVRTHDLLSPSPKLAVQRLQEAGLTPDAARDVFLFQQYGLVPVGRTAAAAPRPATSQTVLFSGPSADQCARTNPASYDGAAALRSAFSAERGAFATLASTVSALPDPVQVQVLTAARGVACGL